MSKIYIKLYTDCPRCEGDGKFRDDSGNIHEPLHCYDCDGTGEHEHRVDTGVTTEMNGVIEIRIDPKDLKL